MPLERWRHLPPDAELDDAGPAPPDGPASSASGDSARPYSSTGSASSLSASSDTALSLSLPSDAQPAWALSSARGRRSRPRTFTCGFCARPFSKRHDWLRHERSLHVAGDTA